MTQSTEAVKYTDWISADGWDTLNKCPPYDKKQSSCEAGAFWNVEYLFTVKIPRSTLTRSGSSW